jgi:hypothetical protein
MMPFPAWVLLCLVRKPCTQLPLPPCTQRCSYSLKGCRGRAKGSRRRHWLHTVRRRRGARRRAPPQISRPASRRARASTGLPASL